MNTRLLAMISLVGASVPLAGCPGDDGPSAADESSGTTDSDPSTGGDETPADSGDTGQATGTDDATDDTGEPVEPTTFAITIANAGRYYAAHVFNTPDGAEGPGPLTEVGGAYVVEFAAVPGTRLNFATMSAATNDWFFGPEGAGIALFDDDGPVTGDITDLVDLWDAGTEEEDPATIATAKGGGEAGEPDDDDTVRVQMADVSGSMSATLDYAEGLFTLTLTREGDDILTPGLVVIHSGGDPLFEEGQPDREYGLERLAEAGDPGELAAFFNEAGDDGAPLRLASSHSPLSPGVVYAFGEDADPLFVQGEAAREDTGLEELAEAGNNQIIYDYLTGAGYSAAQSENEGGVGPGGALTFTLDAVPGDKLGIATMFVQSNDWIVAFNNNGVPLFDDDGNPLTGMDASVEAYLFDVGTEADEAVGFGENQAPRQADADAGEPDEDTTIRRVEQIDDVQFGKGAIDSGPGVVALADPRGGYNLVYVDIQLAQ